MASGAVRVVRGSFKATGAELSVESVGFRPGKVTLYNSTDNSRGEWVSSMPDESMQKQKAAVTSFATSNGITPIANGFTLGADADLNAADDVVYWEASE